MFNLNNQAEKISRRRTLLRKPRIGLTLAGGGCKAFFGLGVGKVLMEAGIKFHAVSGTSAGSAMAMSLISGQVENLVEYFYAITSRNRRNFYWSRLLLGRQPFPHERMYRSAILTYVDPERILKSKVKLAFNAMRVPPGLFPPDNAFRRYRLVTEIIGAYRNEIKFAEQGMFRPFLAQAGRRNGLEEVVFTEQDLHSRDHALQIVLASSCVPPLVSYQKLPDGFNYLDGGIENNLPITHLPDCDLYITVYYEEISRRLMEQAGHDRGKNIYYIAPAGELPITTWDYANPKGVRECYEYGRRAGERALPEIRRLLG